MITGPSGSRPSLLCVHGAASAAWVWQFWRRELARYGWEVNVLDLRGHGQSLPLDFATVTLDDYLWDIESVAGQITAARGREPVLCGWGMGGLLCLMQASRNNNVPGLILLEPGPPLEVSGRPDPDLVRQFAGAVLGPETTGLPRTGDDGLSAAAPDLTAAEGEEVMRKVGGAEESGLAFRQGLRGVSIPHASVQCPSLLLFGEQEERGPSAEVQRKTALYLGADTLAVAGASHWGMVMSESTISEIAPLVDRWLRRFESEAGL